MAMRLNSLSLPKKFIEPQAQLVYQNININDANRLYWQKASLSNLLGR